MPATNEHSRDSYCGVKLWGGFKEDIDKAHISFNITTVFNDGRVGEMRGEDNFTSWVDIVQNDTLQSSPKKGKAVITSTTVLFREWVPEVRLLSLMYHTGNS